jgi:hypothetical protein
MFDADSVAHDMLVTLEAVLFEDCISDGFIILEVEFDDSQFGDLDDDALAYFMFVDTEIEDGLEFNSYMITCREELLNDLDTFKYVISHELVHVMQEERGDDFNFNLPYLEQPHEIEAYDLEKWLLYEYNLKGKY